MIRKIIIAHTCISAIHYLDQNFITYLRSNTYNQKTKNMLTVINCIYKI